MADMETQAKGSNVKNIIIIVLVALLAFLIVGNTMSQDNRTKFYWFLSVIAVIVFILYILNKKRTLNAFQIGRKILDEEFQWTGRVINIDDLVVDDLDAENSAVGFESGGGIVAYKWSRIDNTIRARMFKKVDAIKADQMRNEILRMLSTASIERGTARRVANEKGFDIVDPNDPNSGKG